MPEIAIYGAGGFGRETALLIEQINRVEKRWELIGFFDDGIKKGETVDGFSVLGGIEEVNSLKRNISLAVAIADPEMRTKIVSVIEPGWVDFPVIAHPQALLGSETNWFGKGCIISAGCIFTTGIVLGEFTIVLATTIGHDVRIGSYSSVMPGCNISGNVIIGDTSLIGTGSQILQNISIGRNTKVGAGAVVTKSYGNGCKLLGVPAEVKE
jgi:sugar O-acyltransferase (sialic acid O-acetyltransferase NeuD family)